MSEHIRAAITTLEHELEAIDQKRGDLESAIHALRKLAVEGVTSAGRGRSIKRGRPRTRTNERTNERTSKARANGTAPTEPP